MPVNGRDLGERLIAWATPPEIWSEDRPSLRRMSAYAHRGAWTGRTGPARRLGVWYWRLVALPAHAAVYLGAWIVERPSRLFAVLLLARLAWEIPQVRGPLGEVIAVAVSIVGWVFPAA